VRKYTLANLSALPAKQIDLLRRSLKGEEFYTFEELFEVVRNIPHGHVEALLGTMRKLGVPELISSRACRQQQLVLGTIAVRLLFGASKLATVRLWQTTLPEELGIHDTDEDELYRALDWLLERKGRIEKKLAARDLTEGAVVLYDVSSSYYEGSCCPLAQFAHNRDGKKGRKSNFAPSVILLRRPSRRSVPNARGKGKSPRIGILCTVSIRSWPFWAPAVGTSVAPKQTQPALPSPR